MIPSDPPLARSVPSGLQTTAFTPPTWPRWTTGHNWVGRVDNACRSVSDALMARNDASATLAPRQILSDRDAALNDASATLASLKSAPPASASSRRAPTRVACCRLALTRQV